MRGGERGADGQVTGGNREADGQEKVIYEGQEGVDQKTFSNQKADRLEHGSKRRGGKKWK